MKQCPYVILKPRRDHRLLAGHPWVFDNEIASLNGQPAKGDRVQLFSSQKHFLGSGFWNPESSIRVRRYSLEDRDFDPALLRERLRAAIAWRERQYRLDRDSCRLVFAEADQIPGLIVDSFRARPADQPTAPAAGYLVIQLLSAGLEPLRDELLGALVELYAPAGIYERGDTRHLEGLPPRTGLAYGQVPERLLISENRLDFHLSLYAGQKTGWFLDQQANRAACAEYARDAEVLDVFCNAGGFSLAAAAAGARAVLAVDASADALDSLGQSASLNGLEGRIATRKADAFDFLRAAADAGERWDLVILDPPAFTKNKAGLSGALRGYKEINRQAMRLVREGGILASFSCSHWLSREALLQVLEEAAADNGRRLRYLQELQQPPDHPMVSGYSESRYLKGFIVQVLV